MAAIEVMTWLCIVTGSFFSITAGLGMLRFPDVYARIHAAGVMDTVGIGLILIGLMLHVGIGFVTAKLLLILAFFLFTSPAANHALARAASHGELRPLQTDSSE